MNKPGPNKASKPDLQRVLKLLPTVRGAADSLREMLLANLVMIGEIPAPTFGESDRVAFLSDRFSECGLQNSSIDQAGNALGILPGSGGDRDILVVAHADTVFDAKTDHTITVHEDRVIGPGVADNSMGLAALALLPSLLDHLGLRFHSDLVLMGSCRSLGRGDLEGLDSFLANTQRPVRAGVCVEGAELGRLSFASIGMLRGEFRVQLPKAYDWSGFGASSAVRIINSVINRIFAIPLPREPMTSIRLGSIRGGTGFAKLAQDAELRFEIRSESKGIVHEMYERMADIAAEESSRTDARVTVDIFARREPGGLPFSHPLIRQTRKVMQELEVEPHLTPSVSELTSFIKRRIPAVTLGITRGDDLHTAEESVMIEPMFDGLAQLIAVLVAIDEGLCDEET